MRDRGAEVQNIKSFVGASNGECKRSGRISLSWALVKWNAPVLEAAGEAVGLRARTRNNPRHTKLRLPPGRLLPQTKPIRRCCNCSKEEMSCGATASL